MAIEKGIYSAPMGVEEESEGSELEIEIVDPEEVTLSDGSVEITLMPENDRESEFDDNLADDLDENELNGIAATLLEMVDSDIESRKEWADIYVKGLDTLGFKYEDRMEPWENACGCTPLC